MGSSALFLVLCSPCYKKVRVASESIGQKKKMIQKCKKGDAKI